MWKAILFTIAMIIALITIGLVVYTLYSGSSAGDCNGTTCSDSQSCLQCNGKDSCQTKCKSGSVWDSDSCTCVEPTKITWQCNTDGVLPTCYGSPCDVQDDDCYSGMTNCSSGCYYGSAEGVYAEYYLYDSATGKADMILYDFSSIPDGMNSPYTDATHSAMILCNGDSPKITRGVYEAFSVAQNGGIGGSSIPSCGDICDDTDSAYGSSGKHKYYFQNYSSRVVTVDLVAKDNNSNHINASLDGTKSCGNKVCLGKATDSTDFKTDSITVDDKTLYFASGNPPSKKTKPNSNDRVHMKAGHYWVFVDISCVNLSL